MLSEHPLLSPPADAFAGILIPGLSNDVALQCLARVPLAFLRPLSSVSKPWRSLLRSPFLLATRSHLRCTEKLLLVRLLNPWRPQPTWLSLLLIRHTNPPYFHHLAPHPSPTFSPFAAASFAGGRTVYTFDASSFWIFDAILDRWERGPSMLSARSGGGYVAIACMGKVYVVGGNMSSESWAEVYDPTLGQWAALPSPDDVRQPWLSKCAVLNGRIYAKTSGGRKGLVFDPLIGEEMPAWEVVESELFGGWKGCWGVADGVLFCCDKGRKLKGFDDWEERWKEVRGVEEGLRRLPEGSWCRVAMVGVGGGKLVLVCEGRENIGSEHLNIICMEIEVRQDSDGEFQGRITWSGSIPFSPASQFITNALLVEL